MRDRVFRISPDKTTKLVLAELDGFLAPEEIEGFLEQEPAAVRAMGGRSGEFSLPIDTVERVIQSQEVMRAFEHIMKTAPLKGRRIAILQHGALPRQQTKRILVPGRAMLFDPRQDAMRWRLD